MDNKVDNKVEKVAKVEYVEDVFVSKEVDGVSASEVVDVDVEVEVKVRRFEFEGKMYLRSSEGVMYDAVTEECVGRWNEKESKLEYEKEEEEEAYVE